MMAPNQTVDMPSETCLGPPALSSTCLGIGPLHVEAIVHDHVVTDFSDVEKQLDDFLQSQARSIHVVNGALDLSNAPEFLRMALRRISVENSSGVAPQDFCFGTLKSKPQIHVFALSNDEVTTEELDPSGGDDEWTAGCDCMTLPHNNVDGLWESLIFEPALKRSLLQYAMSALLFSEKQVSSHIVNWNRILLLYGPPGTGKTSLCRALAQKLAVRLGRRFTGGSTLLDIRSHSLFSKWFSTSGKLVNSLFQLIRDMVQDDPTTLVCVLIDEVESLAASRGNASSGDPSDAMRAVNSLLTSLDRLRSFPNVIVLATTNLTKSIDEAFVDRVDLKIHVGLPILEARYEILKSCIQELQRVGIVEELAGSIPKFANAKSTLLGEQLLLCSSFADGLSGRSLRRLPLRTHALFSHGAESMNITDFLQLLKQAIKVELDSRHDMN